MHICIPPETFLVFIYRLAIWHIAFVCFWVEPNQENFRDNYFNNRSIGPVRQ